MNKVDYLILLIIACGFFVLNRGRTALFFHPSPQAKSLLRSKAEAIKQIRDFRFRGMWNWTIRDIELRGHLTRRELSSIESFLYRCGSKMLGYRMEMRENVPCFTLFVRDWS